MPRAVIPNALRELCAGAVSVELPAQSVRALLAALDARFPGFTEALGENFAVAIDGEVLPEPLLEQLTEQSEVHFLPPVSGGTSASVTGVTDGTGVIGSTGSADINGNTDGTDGSASYEAPTSVEQAAALLGEGARALAGGTDLLVQMRVGTRAPARIVDLKRIGELMHAEQDEAGLHIGAACSTAALRESPALFAHFPGLLEAAALIGSEQIQGRASIGGNLCNASPAADTVPALLVNNAVCEVAGRAGRRRVPVREFCTGPGANILGADELLVALHLPPPPARSADAYLRLTPRSEMDIAVAGAAARIALDAEGRIEDARLALGALGPVAFNVDGVDAALRGAAPGDADAFARAAELARAAARPITDKRGSIAYRREIAGVLAKRALANAAARARSAH